MLLICFASKKAEAVQKHDEIFTIDSPFSVAYISFS